MQINIDDLDKLAMDMAMNMVDTSACNEKENKECIQLLLSEKIFKRRYEAKVADRDSKRVRNVLIIGSGASRDVNECFLGSRELVETLIKEIKGDRGNELHHKLKEIEYKLLRIGGSPKLDFEIQMRALTELKDENYIRRRIKFLLGFKYMPSFFYEIVAHMFRHRAIDIIINYNFDETLDNIIEDEMGKSEYYKIYLNGHCPDSYEKDLLSIID